MRTHSSEHSELPLWVFLEEEPRPVRMVRRLCLCFGASALLPVFWSLLQYAQMELDGSSAPSLARAGLAAGLAVVCALRWRHPVMYYLRWVFPILFFVALPGWRWFLLPVWVIFAVPYVRYMGQFGVSMWYRMNSASLRARA